MDGCVFWAGRLDRDGYARSGTGLAYREAWVRANGPVPDGLELDHLCRNRACVKPTHMEPVTHAENQRRGSQAAQLSCKHGHLFSSENTYIRPASRSNGHRSCRACNLDAVRRYKQRTSAGMTDPLGLHEFTTHILGSIIGLAPVAVVGLVVILIVYGLAFRR